MSDKNAMRMVVMIVDAPFAAQLRNGMLATDDWTPEAAPVSPVVSIAIKLVKKLTMIEPRITEIANIMNEPVAPTR